MEFHFVHLREKTVEHNQFSALQLIKCELPHIRIIGKERAGISKHKFLIDSPVIRHGVIEIIQHPHAVIFNYRPLCTRLFCPGIKIFLRQLTFAENCTDIDTGISKLIRAVFLFPFFTHQQKCFLTVAEASVLQCFLDELRLSGLQKPGEEIDGKVFHLSQC